jgi:hypothetical protein
LQVIKDIWDHGKAAHTWLEPTHYSKVSLENW